MSIALPAPGLAQAFSLIIAGLCRATASRIAVDRSAGPLVVRIFTRLHRLAARLTALVARTQAGKPPPRRPAHRTAGAGRRDRQETRLPQSRGWLLREVPGAAEYAGQVQALLDDPQTAALLTAAPQAGRILRPLCRMLALPFPENLRRPKPPSPPPAGADTLDPPPAAAPLTPSTPPLDSPRATARQSFAAAIGPPPPD